MAAGSLSFAALETTRTLTVTLHDDAVNEPEETFSVALTGVRNATVAGATALATITDGDPDCRG